MLEQRTMPAESEILLRAQGICKSFPGVQALNDVRIAVRTGRLNALVGENGAGKSTLMNILAGVLLPDRGQILLGGKLARFGGPREAQRAGISIIHQELNLVPELSIAENIFLGREPCNRARLIDYRKMHHDARHLLATLGLDVEPGTRVSRLRVGQQQIVEIAKAMSFDARIIIMDEPTSAISEKEVESLFGLIQQLKRRGIGIIYITHKLNELSHIADDITVLRDGRFIAARPFTDVTPAEIVRLMVGRELAAKTHTQRMLGVEVLQVRDISLRHPERAGEYALRGISFAVRRGEVVGLFGLLGAGRTELLQTVFGLNASAATGRILVDGEQRAIRAPADAIRSGIALAPEDRKTEGLVLSMSVAENVSLTCFERATRMGWLSPAREHKLVGGYVDRLQVKTSSLSQCVRYLSGGNQQKVVLGKWLAAAPKVLLLDEPTRGIDINAKAEVYALIDELAREGLGIVVASSELPEILAVADRTLVLAEGRVTAEFSRSEATEKGLLTAALPMGKLRKVNSE